MDYTMMKERIMMQIPVNCVMDRKEIYAVTTRVNPDFKETLFRNMLEKLKENDDLIRVGRNQYRKKDETKEKEVYKNRYSAEAQKIVDILQREFPLMEYRIWELCWLNEFWNHQIAQNKIFVEVERVGCDFVYTELCEEYSGRILLRPTEKELYRYGGTDTIIVDRMVSEAPKGPEPYNTPLEKIVVDLFANKKLRGMVHDGEYANAIADMFDKYYIDQVKLFRYASYMETVKAEIAYRGNECTVEDALIDTIETAACIISRGNGGLEEYGKLLSGIKSIRNHIFKENYSGEIAAIQACSVMYMATCVLKNKEFVRIEKPENYIKDGIGKSKYKNLSYIKKIKLEAYGYLVEAVRLLEE